MRGFTNDADDPLTRALAPPAGETPAERDVRLAAEAEARRVSDEIDEALDRERAALKKKKRNMTMLLLGQSESGKSTTLKNMQMTYTPRAWAQERAAWKAVIQLNLTRTVLALLDALASELASHTGTSTPPSTTSPLPTTYISPLPTTTTPSRATSTPSRATPPPQPTSSSSSPSSPTSSPSAGTAPLPALALTPEKRTALLKLKLRLAPLRLVEADLKARLGAGTDEITESTLNGGDGEGVLGEGDGGVGGGEEGGGMMATPFDDAAYASPSRRSTGRDVVVRSHWAWKDRLRRTLTSTNNSTNNRAQSPETTLSHGSNGGGGGGERDSATEVLAGCAEDMAALWEDGVVREVVRRRGVMGGLGESAGYFLEHIPRIATRAYEPSDDDVLRARIRTLGVQEYALRLEVGDERDVGKEWTIYDVGGSRTSRHAWLPYFADVHAILFLAPISAFDERLAEDRRVNRLEDTFLLWSSIVKAEALRRAVIILFMNKCDVLDAKLRAGTLVRRYMTSYGARPNDAKTFSSYLKTKFRELLNTGLPDVQRPFYCYPTSAVDAEAMGQTLRSVRDGILQSHLQKATLVA